MRILGIKHNQNIRKKWSKYLLYNFISYMHTAMCMVMFLLGTLSHTSMGFYRLHCKILHNEPQYNKYSN